MFTLVERILIWAWNVVWICHLSSFYYIFSFLNILLLTLIFFVLSPFLSLNLCFYVLFSPLSIFSLPVYLSLFLFFHLQVQGLKKLVMRSDAEMTRSSYAVRTVLLNHSVSGGLSIILQLNIQILFTHFSTWNSTHDLLFLEILRELVDLCCAAYYLVFSVLQFWRVKL